MFTGIIEATGVITELQSEGTNRLITIRSSISPELHIDQSVSHDGVCLTVIGLKEDTHTIVAVEETLRKSTFRQVAIGDTVNLERALRVGDRLDGHMVQGHVDTTLECIGIEEPGGSYLLKFAFAREYAALLIPKGSICLNGVSLTIADLWEDAFLVAVIPYTWEHTNLHAMRPGEVVNAEFDMIGKYLSRFRELLK
jgi:riboflavin synthase